MTTERIGVFGGTFDPPHLGHICVARSAILQFGLSRVLWIPASQSPHKTEQAGASATWRRDMTELCVAEDRCFELSVLELDRGGVSFTVDTLEELNRTYPRARLFLILGADSYLSFGLWKQPEKISELARLIVYPRSVPKKDNVSGIKEGGSAAGAGAGAASDAGAEAEFDAQWLKMDKIEISSSEIRSRIVDGRSVSDLVSQTVHAYIIEKRLYQNT